MTEKATPQFLRLVHSEARAAQSAVAPRGMGRAQETFLPTDHPTTLVFISWRKISLKSLQDVFALCRPKLILDLRAVPHFDLDGLNRRKFFEMLQPSEADYIDLLGRIKVDNPNTALVNPATIAGHVETFTKNLKPANTGPLVFLHDDDFVDDDYVKALALALPCGIATGWQVYRPTELETNDPVKPLSRDGIGQTGRAAVIVPIERRTVFISHATPEDNSFVTWLASKLTTAGYEVWCDIANLTGGDTFWNDIENIIRHRAAKVVFVQSKFAKEKAGVRKEIYLSLTVGKKLSVPRFILPLRIDATPFDETFIELIDLQAIDCRHDWMIGLRSLLAVLVRDEVPRTLTFKAEQFESLVSQFGLPSLSISQKPEPALSNLLSVAKPPGTVNFLSFDGIPTNRLQQIVDEVGYPAYVYHSLIVTTASFERYSDALNATSIRGVLGKIRASISWSDFLTANCGDLPAWRRSEARNQAFGLFNKAWRNFLQKTGAQEGTLANGRWFWFFTDKHFDGNQVRFLNYSGKSIRRQLVGYSKKRRVFWHFSVYEKCVLEAETFMFALMPHVTFSTDGRTILPSKSQLHSLRRSFCRSWWNDRWRDLMQGYVSALAGQNETLLLDVGGDYPVEVKASFLNYSVPVSLTSPASIDDGDIDASDDIVEDFSEEEDDIDDEFHATL